MDWETALKYVRSKKTTSEWDRQKRQQKVLQAALDKVLAS
jgi:anionic cell wall polymer biosynthesis LytR-Cps2A-Psr (LCP) family protein